MKRRVLFALGIAASTVVATAVPASASVTRTDTQVVIKVSGYSVCQGWVLPPDNSTNNDQVKGYFAAGAEGAACIGWLERKRYNADGSVNYNWTRITDFYYVSNYQQAESGVHWNGQYAGTRVCMKYTPSGETGCSNGIW